MYTTLPQVLKLIGNTPHLHTVKVFAERLKVTKALIGAGDISGILKEVVQSGIGQFLQNPIGQIVGQLKGALSAVNGTLDGDTFPKLIAALGVAASRPPGFPFPPMAYAAGLAKSALDLETYTNGISGIGFGEGLPSLFDVASHANTLRMIGMEDEEAISLSTVL